jgi:hypothetical protein
MTVNSRPKSKWVMKRCIFLLEKLFTVGPQAGYGPHLTVLSPMLMRHTVPFLKGLSINLDLLPY